MSAEFWAAIAGAVVGSMSAGFITWFLQKNQDDRQTKERNQGLARSLIFKLMRIYSDMRGFKNHIDECVENGKRDGLESGWRSVRAIGNLPDKIIFSADEMAYLLSLGDLELFEKVLSLDVIHSSTIRIFELYKERRLALTDMLSASMNGLIGTTQLTDAQLAFFSPKSAELDLLVVDISSRVDMDAKDSKEALEQASIAVRATLGPKFQIEFKE